MPVHGLEHPRKILRVRQIFPALLLCLLPGYILLEILPTIPLLDVMPYVPDGTSQSLVAQRFIMAAGLAAYVVIIPILSEILYRGILHRNLREHMPRLPAILISSLVFAITTMLWTPAALVFAFSSGIVFAILYEKTNSLWPAIVIHAIIGFTFSAQTWLVYGP
jgi:membrane protease YdiL (CAAX protease family)